MLDKFIKGGGGGGGAGVYWNHCVRNRSGVTLKRQIGILSPSFLFLIIYLLLYFDFQMFRYVLVGWGGGGREKKGLLQQTTTRSTTQTASRGVSLSI